MVKPHEVPPPARGYHHGNLRQALLTTALEMALANGPERVSVREVARQLGVSPAAPFRHFPTRRALMTAMAEEAALRLQLEVRKSLARQHGDALARLRSIGRGYLAWARTHAAHFRIVSARDQIDLAASPTLQRHIQDVRDLTEQTVRAAQAAHLVAPEVDPAALALLARATAYGLARMRLDGHFGQWGIDEADAPAAMDATLDLLIHLMAASAPRT